MTTAPLYPTLFTSPTTGHDHRWDFEAAECTVCFPYQVGAVVFPTVESAAQAIEDAHHYLSNLPEANLKVVVR